MKHALTLFAIFFVTMLCAQKYLTSFGSLNNDEALSIALDSEGYSYSTGYFNNFVTFQNNSFLSNGFTDVFVVKTSPAGLAEWAFSGGSTGPDRGLAIAVHTDGSTAVTGYYSNNASFGSTVLPANALSQDLFVLKLNANGTVAWAKGFGGSLSDTGFGITFDNTGNILVTGQFRGTINFDGIVFTSTPLPDNEGPSYDTFILKLDSNGTVLWAKQGKNSAESRGLDVKTDNFGNVIVCGQFSDTLTFDVAHPNLILNAAFVAKFDANGNELWFRHFTSTITNAYGIEVNTAGDVYITGDNVGPIIFFANGTSQLFTVDYTFNIYLAKFNSSGTLQWLVTNGSENQVSSRAIALDDEEQPYITGTFRCQFQEYALEYDTGIFYSAGFKDVFISKFNTAGVRQWSRHLASAGDSFCSAIAINEPDNPLVNGSFEGIFVVPNKPSSFVDVPGSVAGNFNPPICSDLSYGSLRRVLSNGVKDVFIAAPIDISRLPIDYFMRPSGICERPYRIPCAYNCLDTLINCGPTGVQFDDYTISILKPLADIEWFGINTGPAPNFTLPQTDTYVWNYTRSDGCISFSDTLHAIIHPVPFPLITDDQGFNVEHPPTASNAIGLCFPETGLIMGTNFNETDSIWWIPTPNSVFIPSSVDSAIYVNQPGTFIFNVENEFGCHNSNTVVVNLFYEIGDPDAIISFQDIPEPVDTIFSCLNALISGDLISASGQPDLIQFIMDNGYLNWSILPTTATISVGTNFSSFSITTNTSGYYTITCIIVGACNSQATIIERTIYIEILPAAQFNLSLTGVNDICPSDSTTIYASGSDNYTWTGPEFIQLNYSSIQAWIPGLYSISTTGVSEFGCPGSASQNFTLAYRPPPVITMIPASGIICPGDSVLLTAEEGIAYQWLGPVGQLLGTTQSIYTTSPGYYSCVVTDDEFCPLESNFLEVITYSTPYLVTIPFSDLCLTGSVDIAAVTHPSATVQWEAPISSNAQIVTITEPGVYTGTINLCGISTTQSVTVIETLVNAFIEVGGPPVICNGDSIQLFGNVGMSGYQWQPGQQETSNIWITEPGTYTLYTFDFQGCQGTSQPLVITEGTELILNTIDSQYLCGQDSIYLSSDIELSQYFWSPNGETTIGIWVSVPGTYQLTATDEFGCSSTSNPIDILQDTLPLLPETADMVHCTGDNFSYSIETTEVLYWLFNDSSIIANPITINNLTSDTTLYYYALSENGCPTPIQSFSVQVITGSFLPQIFGETVVCAGDSVLLYINDFPNSNFEWLVNGTVWSNSTEFGFLTNEASGTNINVTLTVSLAGCSESEQTVSVQILPLPNLLAILGSTNFCLGDTAVLYTNVLDNSTAIWTWLGESVENDSIQIYFTNSESILIQLTASLNGCTAGPTEEWLYFHPYPNIVSIVSNSPVCAGNALNVDVVADNDANIFITAPNGLSSIGGNFQINSATAGNTGFYQIVAETEYCGTADSVWLQVFPAPIVQLGNDSIVCNGGTITYNLAGYENVIWNQNVVSDSFQASESGMVYVEVSNEFGCTGQDEVYLQFEICDGEIGNIFSPNGDGINDNFYFNPFGFENVNFKLYNRWGKLLCEIIDKDYWDGLNCKNGLPVSDGTYFYVLEYITKTKVPGIKKGYVQVMN